MIVTTENNFETDNSISKKYVYSKDIELNYEEKGTSENTLLFIHGFAASLDSWRYLKSHFNSDYKLILIDLKGFGDSSKPNDNLYSAEDQAKIIASFIKHLKLSDVTLIGHSFGGAVSILTFLKLKKEKVIKALVLLDPTIYLEKLNFSAKLLSAPIIKYIIMYLVPSKWKASFTLRFIFNKRKETIKERSVKFAEYLKQPGAYKAMLKSAALMVPFIYNKVTPILKDIDIPVLIIWGEKDKVLPVQMAFRLNNAINDSVVKIIPDCGHVPQTEAAEETANLIKNFYIDNIKLK